MKQNREWIKSIWRSRENSIAGSYFKIVHNQADIVKQNLKYFQYHDVSEQQVEKVV